MCKIEEAVLHLIIEIRYIPFQIHLSPFIKCHLNIYLKYIFLYFSSSNHAVELINFFVLFFNSQFLNTLPRIFLTEILNLSIIIIMDLSYWLTCTFYTCLYFPFPFHVMYFVFQCSAVSLFLLCNKNISISYRFHNLSLNLFNINASRNINSRLHLVVSNTLFHWGNMLL